MLEQYWVVDKLERFVLKELLIELERLLIKCEDVLLFKMSLPQALCFNTAIESIDKLVNRSQLVIVNDIVRKNRQYLTQFS